MNAEPSLAEALPEQASGIRRRRWQPIAGWLLLAAALAAFLFPTSYRALQTVGSSDNQTLDAAGYEHRRAASPVAPPDVRRGDRIFSVLMDSHQAAVINKNASDRRGVALLLGLPGAFLLGLSRTRPS